MFKQKNEKVQIKHRNIKERLQIYLLASEEER